MYFWFNVQVESLELRDISKNKEDVQTKVVYSA